MIEMKYFVFVGVIITLIMSSIIIQTDGTTISEIDRLITNLTTGYNKEVRPPDNNTETLYVNCTFFLLSIVDYDDISGVLSVTGGVTMSWIDNRFKWNPNDFSGTKDFVIRRSFIWTPEPYVINPADSFDAIADDTHLARVFSNGRTAIGIGDHIKILCPSNMAYFPFDVQYCYIRLAPWGYMSREVSFLPQASRIELSYYTKNNMWDIDSTSAEIFALGQEFNGMVSFTVNIRRQPLYFSLSMMMPVFFLCFLNPFIFLMPAESGERISFAVTIFLSFAVFMTLLSDNLPKSSTPLPIICYFLFVAIVNSGFIMIIAILLLGLHFADINKEAPKWLCNLVFILRFKFLTSLCCKKRSPDMIQNLEKSEAIFSSKKEHFKLDRCIEVARELDKVLFFYSELITFLLAIMLMILLSQAP